jgi:hypothetical protein
LIYLLDSGSEAGMTSRGKPRGIIPKKIKQSRRQKSMLEIVKRYIVDESNNRLAVEIDIDTFNKIEEVLENYGLYHLMKETEYSESLTLSEAKEYYKRTIR